MVTLSTDRPDPPGLDHRRERGGDRAPGRDQLSVASSTSATRSSGRRPAATSSGLSSRAQAAAISGSDLRVPLHAPGRWAEPERLMPICGRGRQQHGARGQQVDLLPVPLQHPGRGRQARRTPGRRQRTPSASSGGHPARGRPAPRRTPPSQASASSSAPRQMPSVGRPVVAARDRRARVAGSQGTGRRPPGPSLRRAPAGRRCRRSRSSGPGSSSPAYGCRTSRAMPASASQSPHHPGPVLASCCTTRTVGVRCDLGCTLIGGRITAPGGSGPARTA